MGGNRQRDYGMEQDSLLCDRMKSDLRLFIDRVSKDEMRKTIGDLIVKHRGGKPVKLHIPQRGRYNCCLRMEFEDGQAMMRVPLPGRAVFSDDKTRAEVNMMRYVAEKTSIPIPKVYHWGTAVENPTGLGPFIIMEYIPHAGTLNDALKNSGRGAKSKIINFALPDHRVQELYRKMAWILLQLDTLAMPGIGSVSYNAGVWTTGPRPVTQNITEIVTAGGCPESVLLSDAAFASSDEFFSSVADQHMAQFIFQHNTAIVSKDDACDKYMARYLFRELVNGGLISSALRDANHGGEDEIHKLIADDLNPKNVLVNEGGEIVGVISWEFAYFGPASIASAPPWWLLVQRPEHWYSPGGIDEWNERYPRYLDIFLKAMESEEEALGQRGAAHTLSSRMRNGWESGSFWIATARRSYAFDPIYWKFIDTRFFKANANGGFEGRLERLPQIEQHTLDWTVSNKLQEWKNKKLLNWTPNEARACLELIIGKRKI